MIGDIEELESLDRTYIKRVLNVCSSTPIPALYLELGVIPIRFIIQAKRLMFLHYLLSRNDNELVSQVLKAQIDDPVKGDWILTVKEDLISFDLNYLSFDDIKNLKKEDFKKIVKKARKNAALKYLLKEKEEKCANKMSKLKYENLSMRPYFKTNLLTQRKQILLFKFRCRMVDVGRNFGRNNCCPVCLIEEDNQEHLFLCDKLYSIDNLYNDLFSNDMEKVKTAIDTGYNAIRKREKIVNAQKSFN